MPDLGYVIYIAMIVVPGYGFSELLGVWKSDDDFIVMLTYVVGLGLAIDTLVIAIKTWGVSAGSLVLKGFGNSVVYFIIATGVVALLISAVRRRGLRRPPRVTKGGLGVVLLSLLMGAIILAYFQKYPIFPQYIFADFHRHVEFAAALANGSAVSAPREVLYGGIEYQLGAASLLVGGDGLVSAQRVIAILVVASPLFFYTATLKLFGSERAAILTTLLYAVSGTVWVNTELWSGLYANIFGILAALLLIIVFIDLTNEMASPLRWAASILVLGCAYFSHYSILSLLPSFVVIGLISLRRRGGLKRFLLPAGVFVAPAALGALVFPGSAAYIARVSFLSGGVIHGTTTLASLMSPVPVLSYLAIVFDNDFGLAATLVLLFPAVYFGWKERRIWFLIPLVWLVALLVAAPLNVAAWRFSIEAAVPLTMLSGYGLHSLMPPPRAEMRRKNKLPKADRWFLTIFVAALFLTPIVFNSVVQNVVVDAGTNQASTASIQAHEYSAIQWLGQNTPAGSRYLAVDDPQFLYVNLILSRNTTYVYFSSPLPALEYARANNYGYIVVTPDSSYPVATQQLQVSWQAFQSTANLTVIYETSSVRVFHVS